MEVSMASTAPAPSSTAGNDSAERERAVESVRALHHLPLKPKRPKSNFSKLKVMADERNKSDASVVGTFEKSVAAVAESMEQLVIDAARGLRTDLEGMDQKVLAIQTHLADDATLIELSFEDVQLAWKDIDQILLQCSDIIERVGDKLAGIEGLRREQVGLLLKSIIEKRLAIGAKSSGGIERAAEAEAHELNQVIIKNKLALADLLASLRKVDVIRRENARKTWLRRLEGWRALKHDRALSRFHADLACEKYVDPPMRQSAFKAFQHQQGSHEGARLHLVTALAELFHASDGAVPLSSEEVQAIRSGFANVDEQEQLNRSELQQALVSVATRLDLDAKERKEALRKELHAYGALNPEPDLASHAQALSHLLANESLDDWFRTAGGLKVELRTLVDELGSPDIIYEHILQPARKRIELILAGCSLDTVLEAKGKGSLRRGMLDATEALRRSRSEEIVPLLPTFKAQASDLAGTLQTDDSPSSQLLVEHLLSAAQDIDVIMSSADQETGQAELVLSQSAIQDLLKADGFMAAVRHVQKRMGLLASACELPKDSILELQNVATSLQLQVACNQAVDEVISEHTDSDIALRTQEHAELSRKSILALDLQARALQGGAERLCNFCLPLACEMEEHAAKDAAVDEAAADALFECGEDFRIESEAREADLVHATDRLRKAADEDELASFFQKVLNLLDEVEAGYRSYHGNALVAVADHIDRAREEGSRHEQALSGLLGLSPKHAAEKINEQEPDQMMEENFPRLEKDIAEQIVNRAEDFCDESEEDNYDPWLEDKAQAQARHAQDNEGELEQATFWRGEFAPDPSAEELEGEEREAYMEHMSSSFVLLDHEAVESLSDEDREIYGSAKESIEAWRINVAAEERAVQREKDKNMPLSVGGDPVAHVISFPIEQITDLIKNARRILLALAKECTERRMQITETKCDEIRDGLTAELEERLRRHWPRKGRVEVSARQPRHGELTAHKMKALRFVRQVQKRLEQQSGSFQNLCEECSAHANDFVRGLADIRGRLHEAANLATLQGSESRAKKLNSSFLSLSTSMCERIALVARDEPARLARSCDELLRTCVTFDEGGNYDEAEIEALRLSLDVSREQIEAASQERSAAAEAAKEQCIQAARGMDDFREKYSFFLHELSLQQGLGTRYGAPRRGAQERLRAETAQDEMAATSVDDLLDCLRHLASADLLCTSTESSQAPISCRIRSCLLSLRSALVSRGEYLEFLVDTTEVNWTAALPDDPYGVDDVMADLPQPGHKTFTEAIDQLEEGCRQATRKLYEDEGKEALLGEGSVPESLELWLCEMRQKALGPAGQLEMARRRLREQLLTFELLVGKEKDEQFRPAPVAAIVAGAFPTIERCCEPLWLQLLNELASIDKCRQMHLNKLRPSMGTPQASDELAKLLAMESNRAANAQETLTAFNRDLLNTAAGTAQKVAERIAKISSAMLLLLDTAPTVDDLKALPGDESIVKKRKSLKRLQKALRSGRGPPPAHGTGRNWQQRSWKGIEASILVESLERAGLESAEPWAAKISLESAREASITPAHRSAIRARDEAIHNLSRHLADEVDKISKALTEAAREESQWAEKWEVLTSTLVFQGSS